MQYKEKSKPPIKWRKVIQVAIAILSALLGVVAEKHADLTNSINQLIN